MKLRQFGIGLILGLACCAGAQAGNASLGWGTTGNSDSSLASSTLNNAEANLAESVMKARNRYNSITACGVCVYYQITGDNNTISGNSTTGTNTGTVSANGQFNIDGW